MYKRQENGAVINNGSYENAIWECEQSLKRLNTDHIDIYIMHWPDPATPVEVTMKALADLKKSGKIRFIGVSNFDRNLIEEAQKVVRIDFLQPPYSMVEESQKELLAWCETQGIGTMTYGSLGAGILTEMCIRDRIATILVSVMFAIASPSFLKVTNILDIFRAASIIGIMGIGLTIVQSTGDFDFAIGAEATVGACAIAKIMVELIPNFYIAFLLTMIVVACIGLFNSYIVINIGMQAFVATFGVSTLMVGICKFLTGGGQYYSTSWPSGFSILGQGFVLGIIPVSVILLALCTIIAFVFMEKTKTGRYIYAVGANPVACLLYTS